MNTTIYQTVAATPDKGKIIRDAPFKCEDDPEKLKEWLGSGYYFWDTFIELAHWWGQVHYKNRVKKNYVICQTSLVCEDDEILDLVGNLGQVKDVRDIVEQMRRCPEYNDKTFKAQTVINFIRYILKVPYKAVRAYGENSSHDENIIQHRLKFSKSAYLNLCPEVQICVIDKSVIALPVAIVYNSEEQPIDSLTV